MPFHVVFHINLFKRNRNVNTGILNFTARRITQDLSKMKHNCTMNRKDRNMVIHDLEFYLNQEWKMLKIIEYSVTFPPSTSDHKIEKKGQQGSKRASPCSIDSDLKLTNEMPKEKKRSSKSYGRLIYICHIFLNITK